jgi:hypothetical protein
MADQEEEEVALILPTTRAVTEDKAPVVKAMTEPVVWIRMRPVVVVEVRAAAHQVMCEQEPQ